MQTARCTILFTLAFVFLTVSLVTSAQTPLQFVAVPPCRAVDTRNGNPITGGTQQDFPIQGNQGSCAGIPTDAAAYSFNVTAVPYEHEPLGYLTVWPAGSPKPPVSTLNSTDGRVKANAAIVAAGTGGAVSVYATNTTDVVLDIDGYFAAPSNSTLAFFPITPCRAADTRNGQFLPGGQEADFPIIGLCNIPSVAAAYSLNFTALPYQQQELGYLTVWPAGQTQPFVSTLNSPTGEVVANAALVGAGSDPVGDVAVYPLNDTDLIIDVDGYYAPISSAPGGLSLFTLTPCRILDTRLANGAFYGTLAVNAAGSPCQIPSLAQTLVLNATVVPLGPLGYLALWPNGQPQPPVSTLNAPDGTVTSNMAVTATTNGFINAYATYSTQLLVDISSYFAIPSGLNGNYTFTIDGYNTPGNPAPSPCQNPGSVGPFKMVGSFVADGNGNVTGVVDLNCANLTPNTGPPTNVTFKGTYSIQPNGLGTMTIIPTLNAPFDLSLAISSTGGGRLILNNESSNCGGLNNGCYLPMSWGAGAINVQNPADVSLQQIGGSYASGFSGVDPSLNRYAGAGMYLINQLGRLSSTFADANDNGVLSSPLTSGVLFTPDPNTGRGTAKFISGGLQTNWVYYVTSANELTFMEVDNLLTTPGANLVLQTMLRQATLPFGNSTLNGVSVVRTSGLSHTDKQKRRLQGGGTTDVVLGLFTADGNGNGSVSLDENNGGTLTQQTYQGTYSVAPSGRVTLTGFGNGTPPIFYLVNQNEAFVLGQDSSVASGFLVPQGGAPFSNASATGAYWGGNYMPVTMNVTDSVTMAFTDGAGNLTGTNVTSGSSGLGGGSFNGTYSVDATGRMTLMENGNLAAILYVISPTRVAMLPAMDMNPSVAVLGSTN